MIPQHGSTPSYQHSLTAPHLHTEGDACPWCEQEIPSEKLEEISGKIAKRESEREHAIRAALDQQHAIEKAQAAAKAKADLEFERQQGAAREELAREEARKTAEAVANEKLAEAKRSREELQAALLQQVDQSDTARKAAEEAEANLRTQLQQI